METLESSRMCRLCGQQSGISINIFDENENHVRKINAMLPIMVCYFHLFLSLLSVARSPFLSLSVSFPLSAFSLFVVLIHPLSPSFSVYLSVTISLSLLLLPAPQRCSPFYQRVRIIALS